VQAPDSPPTRNGGNQQAPQFEFDRNANRIMALPNGEPRFEYCEIRFESVRETGNIFDASGMDETQTESG